MAENLIIGISLIVFCMIVQCAMVAVVVRPMMTGEHRHEDDGSFLYLAYYLSAVLLTLMVGNLLQITIWAFAFTLLGEFEELGDAVYHSMVNFTSLGYGDIVMSEEHRLLGSMEAMNGMLMIGLSTSVLYSVFQFTYQQRFNRQTTEK
ncbi:MAG: ion channel [Hyphomicrobiales bacterium]